MLKKWLRWLKALIWPEQRVQGHPEMASDSGERRYLERKMEDNSMHVGRHPHPG